MGVDMCSTSRCCDNLTHDRGQKIGEVMRVVLSDFNDVSRRFDEWADILSTIHNEIDVLVVWGFNSQIDEINVQWFGPQPIFEQGNVGNVRVFRHR